MSAARGWRSLPERGSVLGIRFLVWVSDVLGRRVSSFCLWWAALYFALLAGSARRASLDYLPRVGLAPSFANVVRHLWHFGRVALDRYLFVRGRIDDFTIGHDGHEVLRALAERTDGGQRRGALLLGSHFGSFEAMRTMAQQHAFPLSVVADFGNAQRINGVLEKMAPSFRMQLIPMQEVGSTWMIAVRDAVDEGSLVALLGDRLHEGREERAVEVDFLGGKARLPIGPFVLAHLARCPIYLVFGVFHAPAHYQLVCECLAEDVRLPRAGREQALQELAQRYADALEKQVRIAPFNWFNFYDFWS